MKLTDFFEKSYCVNLDRRPDRWSESLDEFNKFNEFINYTDYR